MRTLATIDIGSNTAHMLVARSDGKRLQRSVNRSDWLALGQVVSRHGELPASSVRDLLATLAKFRTLAMGEKVESVYVFATEAMRTATNHESVLRRIHDDLGLVVDLISPKREAELGLRGAWLDFPVEGPFTYLELGGGSLQVARAEGPFLESDTSLPVGTGRLIAEFDIEQPCSPTKVVLLREHLRTVFQQLDLSVRLPRGLATGGVARGLWRALHPDGAKYLAIEELDYIAWTAQRLDIPTLVARFGVKERRAATLLPGSIVYRTLLDALGLPGMSVSEYGVREGALLDLAAGRLQPCLQ